MYQENDGKPVILVGHSMGCLFSYYLLLHQPQEWRDRYIKSWITIAAPFAGAADSWKALVTGDNMHIPIYNPITWRPLHQSLSSMHSLLPDVDRFNDMVIMTYNGTDYTSKDLPELLIHVMNHTNGYMMWKQSRDTFKGYPFPNVTTHCLRGTDVPTPECLRFGEGNAFPAKPSIIYGPGDGTVNKVSGEVCLDWSGNDNFSSEEFSGITHTAMVRDANVVAYVIRQVLHANIYSDLS